MSHPNHFHFIHTIVNLNTAKHTHGKTEIYKIKTLKRKDFQLFLKWQTTKYTINKINALLITMHL